MEQYFPTLSLIGLATAVVGFLALIVAGFLVARIWGFALLFFPPTVIPFSLKHFPKARWPLVLLIAGTAMFAFPPIYSALKPIDLGPFKTEEKGEVYLTLTGWDRSDYSVLFRHPEVVVLKMANPDVTDATLNFIKPMKKLRDLDLSGTAVTDQGLTVLAELPALEGLKLRNTKVTDQSLTGPIAAHKILKNLDLRGTKVNREAVTLWRDALPDRKAMR
jgi:hypothetical protein